MAAKTVKRIKLTGTKATEVEQFSNSNESQDPQPMSTQKPPAKTINPVAAFFIGIGSYFSGSWKELREVRWPNRRATWGLTFAVIAFTAFFVVIILILDGAFQYLFKEVLLK